MPTRLPSLLLVLLTAATPTVSAPGRLVVVNQKEHTVLLVDPVARREVAKVVVGVNGHEVALSSDGRLAYVPIYSDVAIGQPGKDGNTIDVVDLAARKVTATIDLGKPVRPHRAQLAPDGLLYVTAELANVVDVVDLHARKVVGQIPTNQPQSHMLVLSPDARRAYTANVSAGSVSILDLVNRKLIAVIPVAKRIQRISISPDGRRVFTHDIDTPRVAVIDTSSNHISSWIDMPGLPYSSAVTPDGNTLLVITTGPGRPGLHAVDLKTLKVARSFDLPAVPLAIMIRPDGAAAYVSCISAGTIAVLNLNSWQMEAPITLTPGVDGMAWTNSVE